MHICIVEDEASIADAIQLNLELDGYEVTLLRDGEVAKNIFENELNFDLVILDVMLPNVNGVELCKFIRTKSNVPILFLSAKGTTQDRIEGLKAGGNDYLPKPFDLEELLLRIAILTKSATTNDVEKIGHHEVNFKTFTVTDIHTNKEIELSRKEIALLKLFFSKQGEVVSREEILEKIWGANQNPTSRTIDNYILNLRKILEENPKNPQFIHSIRGVGYKFTI